MVGLFAAFVRSGSIQRKFRVIIIILDNLAGSFGWTFWDGFIWLRYGFGTAHKDDDDNICTLHHIDISDRLEYE